MNDAQKLSSLSLALGIASLIATIIPVGGTLLMLLSFGILAASVCGMVLGAKARKLCKMAHLPTGRATLGMTLGIIGTTLGVLFFVFTFASGFLA